MSDPTPEELLLEAAKRGNEDLLQKTLQNPVQATYADGLGNTALHYAAAGGHAACMQMLISAGALPDVTVVNFAGDTVLHKAVVGDNAECVQMLINQGAPINVSNKDGKTPVGMVKSNEVGAVLQAVFGGPGNPTEEDVASEGGSDDEE